MIISVAGKKGGVGKTSLAHSIARDIKNKDNEGHFLLSNDDSTIELAYPGKAKVMDKLKLIDNAVYDFGGFVDTQMIKIINKSDFVIVPLTSDLNSFKKTVSFLKEIKNKNIIIIANKSEKEDFAEIREFFKKSKYPLFEIKSSRIWKKTFEEKKSVLEIKNDSKINKYIYRNSLDGYESLIKYIKDNYKG